jgi:glutamate-5-semialdehyde dehydrogenase
MMKNVETLCREIKNASRLLATIESDKKNQFLTILADWLLARQEMIVMENTRDIADGLANGLSDALIDRLTLTPARIEGMANDVRHVVTLPDPVREVFENSTTPQGLRVRKQRVPLGVLAVIYESRPNVTVDVAALAIKSGNAIILRGGKETIRSNQALVDGIHAALEAAGLPKGAVQFISEPDRSHVETLLKMHTYIDMLIPRGGAGLHQYCRENSTIPVITGGIGICHLFVDESAELAQSVEVIRNAKIQRPTVCNALDTVLVHQAIAAELIPMLVLELQKDGVSFRLDPAALAYVSGMENAMVIPAGVDDFDTEWLSLVLSVKVVDDVDQAINHIAAHSTHHSDGILTTSKENAQKFITMVDSAAVYVNASTRFTDGSQLGLGAEVAISTQRLHARGPMALRELTTYKWVIEGDYTIRQ